VFSFLESAKQPHYFCGCRKAQALPGTKIYHFEMDTDLSDLGVKDVPKS
jgi:hypothetical protein